MSKVFETGSAKWLRFTDTGVQFTSDRTRATDIRDDDLLALIDRHKLKYCAHTLVLEPSEDKAAVASHVKGVLARVNRRQTG